MNNLDFINIVDTQTTLIAKKRPDGGFREHPSAFFKRNCLTKFPSTCLKEIANALRINTGEFELFMSANLNIDIDLAEKLEKGTNVGTATWLELQRQYDSYNTNKQL
ncbi:hypothetical protein GBO14_09035 [Pseudoalteromonas shioyasakiensis]|uniref:hypothetical protein n=1 Tax=Pseudoalteromonas shioyasakiensis TaxID=1190813 RepID=UPI0020950ED6|nr:hypothetical protein [Pseudoalteromonas shioyasakiensis]MCO6354860.1 hypothetical protein [Pseudoalteromonas shioyasakiensis]